MANKNEAKKPNIFVRMGRKIKEVFSELKRVTWPTFPNVVKSTCVVLAIVVIFLLIVTGINQGLQKLLEFITSLGE
jgi:preprotein translocase subunit SecE